MNWDVISRVADVLGLIGFFISLATLILAMHIRKKVLHHSEKLKFQKDKKTMASKLEGLLKVLRDDGQYENDILQELSLDVNKYLVEFSFASRPLKSSMKALSTLAKTMLLSEANRVDRGSQLALCEQINKLVALVNKEDVIV